MKLLVITFTTDPSNPGYKHLIKSLDKHGYEHYTFGLKGEQEFSWGGDNYTPMIPQLKEELNNGYTHILYTDAWDTLAMGNQDELIKKYLDISLEGNNWIYSAEKNPCFTKDLSKYDSVSRWKYLCAGNFIAPTKLFIDIVEAYKRHENENDQQWGSWLFENDEDNQFILDVNCQIFQTLYNMNGLHQQPNWKEFAYSDEDRIVNLITGSKPVFIHGNGKVDMRSIYHP